MSEKALLLEPPGKEHSFGGGRVNRYVIVCFGFDDECKGRQPWYMADGLAKGFSQNGCDTILITDAKSPPLDTAYPITQVKRLFENGRPDDYLWHKIQDIDPDRVFLITGTRQLTRLQTLDWSAPTSLIIASPKLHIKELLKPFLKAGFKEKKILALPLFNSLIRRSSIINGFKRSGADQAIYLSRESQERFHLAGLPKGRLLRPAAEALPDEFRPRHGSTLTIAYMGPPLHARGAFLAIQAFEKTVAKGLDARLLMLMRPDRDTGSIRSIHRTIDQSSVHHRVHVIDQQLEREQFKKMAGTADIYLLPFVAPISDAPLVVIEAALSGKPVVVLDAPGVTAYAKEHGSIVAKKPDDLPQAIMQAAERVVDRQGQRSGPTVSKQNLEPFDSSWDKISRGFMASAGRRLEQNAMIALCGVDGSGKTLLLRYLMAFLHEKGIAHQHIWSRFRNYASKPLLGLTRLTGHNKKGWYGNIPRRNHFFRQSALLGHSFLTLQSIDMRLDLMFRYARAKGTVLADRCVVDMLADLCADTGLNQKIIQEMAPKYMRMLPAPYRIVIVNRPIDLIRRDRPDAFADPQFYLRREAYLQMADRWSLPVIQNNAQPEDAIVQILSVLQRDSREHWGIIR